MCLSLSVTSYKGTRPPHTLSIRLDKAGATIGRNNDNTWVLPDQDKNVSRIHAKIIYKEHQYIIIDSSANGTIINGSITLTNGQQTQLANGDELRIGEYLIRSEIEPNALMEKEENQITRDSGIDDIIPSDPFADLGTDPIGAMISESQGTFAAWEEEPVPARENEMDPFHTLQDRDTPIVNHAFKPFTGNTEAPAEKDQNPFVIPPDWDKLSPPLSESPDPPIEHIPATKTEATIPRKSAPPAQTERRADATQAHPAPTQDQELQQATAAFLQGAGLQGKIPPERFTAERYYAIGAIFRIMLQGTIDVLAARSKIKNELHLDITTVQSAENNPIKFSVTADDAMKHLLEPPDSGYMPPAEAMNEVYSDIKAHQIAVLTGTQTALQSVLERFDPEKLERRLQKHSPISASIPIHKQAKLWELFEQLYEEIEHEATDDFIRLFGRTFAKAYEEQIEKLKPRLKKRTL